MSRVSRGIDRIEVTFDDAALVANGGLLLVGSLIARLGLERLVNSHRLTGHPIAVMAPIG